METLPQLQIAKEEVFLENQVVQFIRGREDGLGDLLHTPRMDSFIGKIGRVISTHVYGSRLFCKVIFDGEDIWAIPNVRLKSVDLNNMDKEDFFYNFCSHKNWETYVDSPAPAWCHVIVRRYFSFLTKSEIYNVLTGVSTTVENGLGVPYSTSNLCRVIHDITEYENEREKRFVLLKKFLLKADKLTLSLFFSDFNCDLRSIKRIFSFVSPKKRPMYWKPRTPSECTPQYIRTFTEHANVQFMPRGSNLRPVNGRRVPQRTCAICERVTEKRYVMRGGRGYICFECILRSNLRQCIHPGCENVVSDGIAHCTKHRRLYAFCILSSSYILRRDGFCVGEGVYVRKDLRDNYGSCSCCGVRRQYWRMLYTHEGGWKCLVCCSFTPGVLHSYSYKPNPVFFDVQGKKSSTHKLFFGLELELETSRRQRKETACKIFHSKAGTGFAYCKTDGSIGHGIEIVTHPASFEFWKIEEAFFDGIKEIADKVNAHAEYNTGIHVHVSRKAFSSEEHIRRFALFFSAIHMRYPVTARTILGRAPNRYCNLIITHKGKPWSVKNIPYDHEKYTQVNTGLENTVEVRAFASSTNKEDILRCIETVHAVFMFTKHEISLPILCDPEKKFLTWFTSFVRRMGYKNLIACFNANNIK